MSRTLAVLLSATLTAACGGQDAAGPTAAGPTAAAPSAELTPVAATAEWPAAAPAAEGIDASRLSDLVLRIRRGDHGRIASLLVARHGRLVVEEYFSGWSAERAHTLQSVTKSVTSLLVGLAADGGRLRLDDPVTRFFPEYMPLANLDGRKAALTVQDLLTMQSGLDWDESVYAGSPLQRLNECRCDWLRFVLDWPMRDQPGTRWEYVSGGTIVLGGIVGSATGSRLDRFAEAELFAPLEIRGASWVMGLPDGLPHAGGGLYLRPRDMAKLGVLMQDEGRWRGRQVVSPQWVRASATRAARRVRSWSGQSLDYAKGWWLLDDRGQDVVTAAGALGQWIFAVPSTGLVVVVTSDNDDGRWADPIGFLYSHVLPATSPGN
ncbi:MAG TPA: serine hydrolase [Vicinamibacteria bacterium]|nr:serine hydrolase [Vicinamibacteria bacterium]